MLMDILMEALMAMDDESLDYVLESCDAEELEIISDAMEAFSPTMDLTGNQAHRVGFRDGESLVDEFISDRKLSKHCKPGVRDGYREMRDMERQDTKHGLKKLKENMKSQTPEYRREYIKGMAGGAVSQVKKETKPKIDTMKAKVANILKK